MPRFKYRKSRSGSKPAKDGKPGPAAMTEITSPNAGAAEIITKAADHQAVPRQGHTEEHQSCSSGGTSKAHTQSTGAVGRANTASSFSGDAVKKNTILQPEATPHSSNDVSDVATFPQDFRGIQPGKPMVDDLISADCLPRAQSDLPGESSSGDCSSLDQTAKVGSCEDEPQAGEAGGTKESPLKNYDSVTTEDIQENVCESSISTADLHICLEEAESEQVTQEFSASLQNGVLKESESFLGLREAEDDMSPSPGDAILGDTFLSLDELAKRIQVEEVHPAAGLVSILKKRNESEGEKFTQHQTKPTKRKVRFQEEDDVLDQEEIGGGSCILLIILCIATVFLSIGGTALYCTFGDQESSVCKDFSSNMDFYYSQVLQGIEELEHWWFIT